MAPRDPNPRTIIPPAGAKTTCPARIIPGSLYLFTHPARQFTNPVRAHFSRRYRTPGPFGAALFLFDALAAALVLALAVTLASLVLLPPPVPLRVLVEASAQEIRAADLVGFTIHYENRGKRPLENASLAIALPDAFRVTMLEANGVADAAATPLAEHGVIPLGTVGPGGNGTVRVAGYMLQSENATNDLRLTATLTGTQRDGQTVQSVSEAVVRVTGSVLKLRWAGAPYAATVADRNPVYVLVADNGGSATVGEVSIVVDCLPLYPYDCPSWTGALSPGESRVIGEHTYLSSKIGPRAEMVSVVGGKIHGLTAAIAEVGTSEDGPWVKEFTAQAEGKGITATVHIGTTGPAIRGGAVRLFPLPVSAVDAYVLSEDTEWEGIPTGSFDLDTDQSKDIAFWIPLKADASVLEMTVRAVVSGCVSNACVWSSSERVAVQPAAPTIAAELRYYSEEGEQLGRGPLPPRVAEKTEYWIVVRAEPGLITRDTELRVELGDHVTYAGKFSASTSGSPRVVGNALVWRPDSVSGDGAFTFAAALAFRPTVDQVGSEAMIVKGVTLAGTDAAGVSTEIISGTLATDVPADFRAAEKGTRVSAALE